MGIEVKLFIGLVINPIKGEWFTVTDTDDVDEAFGKIEAMAEADPQSGGEVMIADCEPSWIGEVNRSDLGEVVEWLRDTHMDEKLIESARAYDSRNWQAILDSGPSGPWKNRAEWAEDMYVDQMGECKDLPSIIRRNIDWDSVGEEMEQNYVELDGDDGTYYVDHGY
jgi:Antirestriction protein (ArdA)